MNISKLTLKQKIILVFIFYALAVVIIGSISYFDLDKINNKLFLLEKSEDFTNNVLQARRYEKNFLLYKNDESFQKTLTYINKSLTILHNLIQQSKYLSTKKELKELNELIPQYKKIFENIEQNFHNQIQKSQFVTRLRIIGRSMVVITKKIVDIEKRQLNNIVNNLKLQLILAIILTILTGFTIFFALFRGVFKTLKTVMDAATMIAHGSFDPIPDLKVHDETKLVIDAFNKMIHELKIHQEQLVQSKKMSSIGTLASGIAHQLNNPLNNILTSAQILKEELPDIEIEFLDKNLSNIESETLRARDIVRNLLEFSRRQAFQLKPTSLTHLVERAKVLAMSELPSGISIHLDIKEDIFLPLAGQRMQEAVLNLVLNAIQAIDSPPGKIFIRCKKDTEKNEAILEVEDTGQGIPEEIQDRIFDPFFTTKEHKDGTGLGLSIVYNIVKKHGGHIKVKSVPGKGSTFIIHLPLELEKSEQ